MEARLCMACGKTYPPEYEDAFCLCGMELVRDGPAPPAPERPPPAPERPPSGTRCLVLYGPNRQPLHFFPLTKDVTVIGRTDPVEGDFPEIDPSGWLDPQAARKVSRRHALILHSRASDTYVLRPLAGNTGTQVEVDMVPAQHDYALAPGTRLILGGAVRFKFEIT